MVHWAAAAGSRLLGGLGYLYPFLGVAPHGRCKGSVTRIGGAWGPRLLLGAFWYLDLFLGGERQFEGPNILKNLTLGFFLNFFWDFWGTSTT